MNVLVSVFACDPTMGSECKVGWNSVKSLAKNKHINFTVITRNYHRKNIESFISEFDTSNIKFVYYEVNEKWYKYFRKNKITLQLYYWIWNIRILKLLKENKLDVDIDKIDITHHITYNAYYMPGFLYKLNKINIIGPVGGGQVIPPGFLRAYKNKIIQEKFRKYSLNIIEKTPFIKNAYKNSSAILVANDETMQKIATIAPDNKNIHKLLETAIELNDNSYKEYINLDSNINIMWAGNNTYNKALILLLESLTYVNNLNNIQVNIIGDINKEKYEKYIHTNNLSDVVNFKGKINFLEMEEEYLKNDLFVFTSLRDTSGNVVLEAMAKGIPIITINHQGVRDIVSHECGIKIECKDYDYVVKELAKKIDFFVDNPSEIEKMGKKSKKRIEDYYSWDNYANKITKIYHELL